MAESLLEPSRLVDFLVDLLAPAMHRKRALSIAQASVGVMHAEGSFGPGAPEALTSTPRRGIAGLIERVVDGPWFGPRTARTWVAPRAASEHNWWSRMLTGRGSYRHYVEFDALPGELANPAWPKAVFSRYQQVMGPGVQLAGRTPTFGVLAPNYGQVVFLGTAVPAGAAAAGYGIYRLATDE